MVSWEALLLPTISRRTVVIKGVRLRAPFSNALPFCMLSSAGFVS